MTNLCGMGACPVPVMNAFLITVGKEARREVVGTNVGHFGEANDNKTEPESAGEQIEEMAGAGVNVLTNGGRASLPDNATEFV